MLCYRRFSLRNIFYFLHCNQLLHAQAGRETASAHNLFSNHFIHCYLMLHHTFFFGDRELIVVCVIYVADQKSSGLCFFSLLISVVLLLWELKCYLFICVSCFVWGGDEALAALHNTCGGESPPSHNLSAYCFYGLKQWAVD